MRTTVLWQGLEVILYGPVYHSHAQFLYCPSKREKCKHLSTCSSISHSLLSSRLHLVPCSHAEAPSIHLVPIHPHHHPNILCPLNTYTYLGEKDQNWGGFGSSYKDNTKPPSACAGGPIAVGEVQKGFLTGRQKAHCWIGSVPPLSSEGRSTLRSIFRSTCMGRCPLYLSPPSAGSQARWLNFLQAFIKSLSWQRHPCFHLGSWHSAQAPECLPAQCQCLEVPAAQGLGAASGSCSLLDPIAVGSFICFRSTPQAVPGACTVLQLAGND